MRKLFLSVLFFVALAAPALAQRTVVSGTVTDANGIPWAGGTLQAALSLPVGASGAILNGVQIGGTTQRVTLDSSGSFLMQLPDNAVVQCTNAAGQIIACAPQTQWTFFVNISPGVTPPFGNGPQTFPVTMTITGASQNISATLSAAAPSLLKIPIGSVQNGAANPTCSLTQFFLFINTTTNQLLLCNNGLLTTASGATATTIDVTLFGVKTGKACIDGTVTNGSPNISSAGQCQWTSADVGRKIFVTNLCSVTVCSFGVGTSSITILPTQTTVARIGTVTDATHVIADCTAPGNCGSPNATATDSGQAVIVYGDDQTTNLNNAFASWTGQTGCPTFLFPDGLILYNAALFTTLPNLATNACTSPNIAAGSGFKNLGQAIGNSAVTFMGLGPTSTLFVPSSDFNFASCTGPNGTGTSCFTGWLSPVFVNIGIWGAGQSLLGAGVGGGVNLVGCRACIMLNTNFTNWGMRAASNAGIDFGGGAGFSYANNMYTNNFGGGTGGVVISGSENQIVNSTIGVGGTSLLVNAGSTLQSSNNIYYGPSQFNAPTIDVLAGKFFSTNDHILSLNLATAPTPGLKVENGGYASVENLFYTSGSNANDSGISVAAGGVLHLKGWKSVFTTLTSGGTIAGTFFDEGGNTFGGPLTITASTASYIADGHSVKGICTGVATAGPTTLGLYGTGPNVVLSSCTSAAIGTGVPVSGSRTLGGLAVTATAAGVGAGSGVVTVLVDGAASTITCTIGTGTTCSDNTHTVTVTDGQRVSIQFTTLAAETLAGVKAIVSWN